MKTKLITAPTVEPVSLAEAKAHLRLDSYSFADDITVEQSIVAGSHDVAAAYSLVGEGIDVLGYTALVIVAAGTCGASGTVDVKIQESDDDLTYADWTGGAFTQITEANDNAVYEKAYTGIKQYIRVVATVGTAACEFGLSIIKGSPYRADDAYVTNLIVAARQIVEQYTGFAFITQTWEIALENFPLEDKIILPYAPIQSVTSVMFYDTDGTGEEFSSDYYDIDTYGKPGRIELKYGYPWPSTTLRTLNGIIIKYVCGMGDDPTAVDERYKTAIKMLISELYENREATDIKSHLELPYSVKMILDFDRIYNI